MQTVAIIQARMGSSRMPGKVLMPLAGEPILWHIIHRLRKCRLLDTIAVATSTDNEDDAIEVFALREGINVVRGSKDNVLARFFLAAEQLNADIIVRITGDAPLIDPVMIDRLVQNIIETGVDFCVGDPTVPSIHEGFSVFTFRALQKLIQQANKDPVAIEHVTAYFKKYPGFVSVQYVPIDPDYQFNGARLSVDTAADLYFLEEVYAHLGVRTGEADVRDVVRLLRAEPSLLEINAHVHQRSADERSHLILFRCDGDTELGLGHVYRCLALAEEMRERHGWGVVFAMVQGLAGINLVRQANYTVENKLNKGTEDLWLDEIVHRLRPDALVLDVRSELTPGSVKSCRDNGVLIVTIDDSSERRLAVDLAFYPPVPQVQSLDWTGFTGQLSVGWEWVVLRRQFSQRLQRSHHERPAVLVTMGGSDPSGLTLRAVEALDLLDEDFRTIVVLGPGFAHLEALSEQISTTRREYDLRHGVREMARLMADCDIALASFGVTAYELAAAGVPAVYLCLTEDHVQSASAFVHAGVAVSLGVSTEVTTMALAEEVSRLLSHRPMLSEMAYHAEQLVDGRGAERISQIVAERCRAANR